jgi:hypothetical protein
MAKNDITKEDVTPSYEELINELSGIISKLVIESAAKTVTIKKLEAVINGLADHSHDHVRESF